MVQLAHNDSQTPFTYLQSLLSAALTATALPPPRVGHRKKDRSEVVCVLVRPLLSRHALRTHQAVRGILDRCEEQPGRGLAAGGNDPDRQRDTNLPSVDVGRKAAGDFLSERRQVLRWNRVEDGPEVDGTRDPFLAH